VIRIKNVKRKETFYICGLIYSKTIQ